VVEETLDFGCLVPARSKPAQFALLAVGGWKRAV
jgi:hypothetical protein